MKLTRDHTHAASARGRPSHVRHRRITTRQAHTAQDRTCTSVSPTASFATITKTGLDLILVAGHRPLFTIQLCSLLPCTSIFLQLYLYSGVHISYSKISFPGVLWSSSSSVAPCGIHWSACLAMLSSHLLKLAAQRNETEKKTVSKQFQIPISPTRCFTYMLYVFMLPLWSTKR